MVLLTLHNVLNSPLHRESLLGLAFNTAVSSFLPVAKQNAESNLTKQSNMPRFAQVICQEMDFFCKDIYGELHSCVYLQAIDSEETCPM